MNLVECPEFLEQQVCMVKLHMYNFKSIYGLYNIYKCKNIFTKMLKDVGIEVPKSIETRSKYTMHADKGRG